MLRILTVLKLAFLYILSANILAISDIGRDEMQAIESAATKNSQIYTDYITANIKNIEKQAVSESNDMKIFLNEQNDKLKSAFVSSNKPKNTAQILLFVSFSMPKQALKSILMQSQSHNAAIILQGLVDNSLPKTLAKITSLLQETNNIGGFQIDPNLFGEYNITKVPAIVVGDSNNFNVVYGVANINEALEVFKNA